MAEALGVVASVAGLIQVVTGLIVAIKQAADNVRTARSSAQNLAYRVSAIHSDLVRIERLPEDDQDFFKIHLLRFRKIFLEVEKFLLKFKRTGVVANAKRILKNGKYAAQYTEFHKCIDSAIIDFTCSLTIHTKNEMWDEEKPLPAGQPHYFPPTHEEMASTVPEAVLLEEVADKPGSDVEQELESFDVFDESSLYSDIPWDFTTRTKATTNSSFGVVSESIFGSKSKSFESKKDGRKDLYSRIEKLRSIPQNTRIRTIRVTVSKLESGDTTSAAELVADTVVKPFFAVITAAVFVPLAVASIFRDEKGEIKKEPASPGKLDRAVNGFIASNIALANTFCHFAIEFVLSNDVIGTIENCVDEVYLYEGKSTRADKLNALSADLETLGIVRTFSDLIRLRNKHRKIPYSVTEHNCKHFAFQALKELVGDWECIGDMQNNTFPGFRNEIQHAYCFDDEQHFKLNEDGRLKW